MNYFLPVQFETYFQSKGVLNKKEEEKLKRIIHKEIGDTMKRIISKNLNLKATIFSTVVIYSLPEGKRPRKKRAKWICLDSEKKEERKREK
jgi:hypothetical protein